MKSDADTAPGSSRLIYPQLPDPLTPADLHRLFSPSYDERAWASTIARTLYSQVALLVQLKMFQTIGRFRRAVGNLAVLNQEVGADECDHRQPRAVPRGRMAAVRSGLSRPMAASHDPEDSHGAEVAPSPDRRIPAADRERC